jgi:transposase InsO family protein
MEQIMGRIDRSGGQDATMERRHIQQMLKHIDEYEKVKKKEHSEFKQAQEFYKAKGLVKQNFLKYYRRYMNGNRDINTLIPHKTGRKFKDSIEYAPEVIEKIKELRNKGYNRYDITSILKHRHEIDIPATSVYRLMVKLGINKLNLQIKLEGRRIIKETAGELGHIDIHYITKGTVKELGNQKLYLLGVIDSYSRICWLEPLTSIKSLDVSFTTLDMLMILKSRYGIEFKEILSDNGSEFSSKNNIENHPFEKMLAFLNIKHRYTKPCKPQTNGKIERLWKTIEHELLSGETFDTLDEFKHYIHGYSLYYNEHRMHQGIGLKIPQEMITEL